MIRPISFANLCVCLSCFKFLLLKSYLSTDFDVHRNWLAITYHLPVREWYFDETSEWTLDYPPLFAMFEWFLAQVAHILGLQESLVLTKNSIRSTDIVVFQKSTVIAGDLVYYYAVYQLCANLELYITKTSNNKPQSYKSLAEAIYQPDIGAGAALLLLFQPGLLLIDHIHFQYNGLLSGFLLLSIASIIGGRFVVGSLWFALLLNLKHIYLYCAPAFGTYLLASYCLARVPGRNRVISFVFRCFKLGLVVITVFIITFGPFANSESIKQILTRLFPFKRGLTHSYWAPNAWSLYNVADKIFALAVGSGDKGVASFTSGLVQEYEHQYLPKVDPLTTLTLVATLTVPPTIKLLINLDRPTPILFLKSVALASFTSFMFGWHVHEKAILLVILPLIPVAFADPRLSSLFLRLALVGTYSLFPLLYEPAEYIVKLTILISYYSCAKFWTTLSNKQLKQPVRSQKQGLLKHLAHRFYSLFDSCLLCALIVSEFYITLIHGRFNHSWNPFTRLHKYDFLPLLLTSSLSAIGTSFSYLELYHDFFFCLDELAVDPAGTVVVAAAAL